MMYPPEPTARASASPEVLIPQRQAAGGGARFDPARGRVIALAYDALPAYYTWAEHQAWIAMARNEVRLFTRASKSCRIQPWPLAGQPYPSSRWMREDVMRYAHLYVFMGGDPHPVRSDDETYRGRAVHDIYAHALPGNSFSADGELRAFQASVPLYSLAALPALATDNLGPTAWYYFHPSNEGKPHAERRWPKQKAGLLPDYLWRDLLP